MRLDFINRTREIAKLERALNASEPSLVVIYGRRRCGKSTLLQHVAGKDDIYYLADQQEPPLQRQSIAREVSRAVPGFDQVVYPSWEALFSAIWNQAPPAATLILDEFPYLVQNSPALPSIIQKFIDKGKNTTNIVICGSSQRMMQGLVLDSTAPLYGRAVEIIKIRPMESGWLPVALKLGPVEAVESYSVWGGVPRYWELAGTFPDHETACRELILDRDGVLHEEPMRLLLDDMRGAGQPHSLLALIAGGANRLSEIAGRLGKPATSLTRPLANLIQLGYLKREFPFGESPRSSKKTLYKLEDPFLKFWYRFVLPNHSMLEQDLLDEVYFASRQMLKAHTAEVWEDLARKSIARLEIAGTRWKPAARWWGRGLDGKNMEIDVMAESMDGQSLLFGEAKWENKTNVKAEINKLEKKAANFPKTAGRTIIPAIWCKQQVANLDKCSPIYPEKLLSALK
jgi:hypothetical protein